jgi:hypothetical protein
MKTVRGGSAQALIFFAVFAGLCALARNVFPFVGKDLSQGRQVAKDRQEERWDQLCLLNDRQGALATFPDRRSSPRQQGASQPVWFSMVQ